MKTENLKPGVELECINSSSSTYKKGDRVIVRFVDESGVVFHGNLSDFTVQSVLDNFDLPKPSLEQRVANLEQIVESLRGQSISSPQPLAPKLKAIDYKVGPHTLDGIALCKLMKEPLTYDKFCEESTYQQWWALVNKLLLQEYEPGNFRLHPQIDNIVGTGRYKITETEIKLPKGARKRGPRGKYKKRELTAASLSMNGQAH